VPVTFAPTTAGVINGQLTLTSDDPDSPTLLIPLSGTGLDFPNIAVAPASLTETLPTGGTSTQQLTITNSGLGDLNFTIPEAEYITVVNKGAAPKPGSLPIDLAKNAIDPRLGTPVVTGAGGPDAFGYKWKDSDEVGGPSYNWIEISGTGTAIPFNDDDQNLGRSTSASGSRSTAPNSRRSVPARTVGSALQTRRRRSRTTICPARARRET
jgi:hypothetical protein